MKKSIVCLIAVLAFASMVQARTGGPIYSTGEVPMEANLKIQGNYISNDGDDEGITVDTSGNVAVSGTLTVSGGSAGAKVETPTALTVTNLQVITVAAPAYEISFVGDQADGVSNLCTLAAAAVGTVVDFTISSAIATNKFALQNTGNLKLSAEVLMDANDCISLRVDKNGNWIERTRSANTN